MMFAGGGLFLSMVATTIWISGDVSRMRTEERAKEAQKCAMAAQADAAQAQTAANSAPASDFSTPPAAQADSACDDTTSGATNDPNADPNASPNGAAVDPVTGEPLAQGAGPQSFQSDPNSGATDPQTGLPMDAQSTGGTADLDSGPIDPATGLPIGSASTNVDPNGGVPVTSEPVASGNVAEAGF